MTDIYGEVKSSIEAAQEETIDESFIDSNRFEDVLYSQCKYKFGKIKYADARSLCIGICYEGDMLIEIYEIKNYKNKVEVLAYSAANKQSYIRFIPDAAAIANSISNFFDKLTTFLQATKDKDDEITLAQINKGQNIQLEMKDLKELKRLYSEVEKYSIFNPCKNCFVKAEHAANYIDKHHIDINDVMHATKTAAEWRMPLVYDEHSLNIIASVNISSRMSDRLCKQIKKDIAAFLKRQGLESLN